MDIQHIPAYSYIVPILQIGMRRGPVLMPALRPSQLVVIIDTREQCPFDFTAAGFCMESGTLKHGDYSIAGMTRWIALERKSPEDLGACMTNQRERFETELLALRGYRYRAVVVECDEDDLLDALWANDSRNPKRVAGTPFGLRSRMKWEGADGTIAAWRARYGIHFIFILSSGGTAPGPSERRRSFSSRRRMPWLARWRTYGPPPPRRGREGDSIDAQTGQ